MMNEEYCKGCGIRIIRVPFFGTPHHRLKEGIYCQKCAVVIVDRKRKSL
jgi:Pyruvate/2-oxoacid:ferredoxin oxidoreductase delta subunit|tara:strand:- start:45 stop:191 length:147 start_codon:yes stop_codon:yes gene_type:complete